MTGRLATPRDIYWAVQGALLALLMCQGFISLPWQLPWGIAAIVQCYLIPSRLNDAGRKPWLPLIVVAAVIGAISLLGAWAGKEGSDGAGLVYAMVSVALVVVTAPALIIWPGLLPSRPPGSG